MISMINAARRMGRKVYDWPYCRAVPGKDRVGSYFYRYVVLAALDRDSVVYSAGVGRDISFEKELVDRVGCRIELFDPSPTGIETMALEQLGPLISFHPIGLAGRPGRLRFAPPQNPKEGSYRLANGIASASSTELSCEDLAGLMRRFGHSHLDLLKMDIEGAEFDVIDQICGLGIPVRQICVEFHGPGSGSGRSGVGEAIRKLSQAGLAVIHKERTDYTFCDRRTLATRPAALPALIHRKNGGAK